MPAVNSPNSSPHSYDYAYIRVVPRVERGEFANVGVILFCRTRRFLGMRFAIDEGTLRAIDPQLDMSAVLQQLDMLKQMCKGEGPIGVLGVAEVFHWVVAPHSTVIQCSPVHSGLCSDPEVALERLVEKMRGE